MLKNRRINDYNSSNNKCGEIFCNNLENYSISCCVCEIKFFDIAEFLFHFRNVHLLKEEQAEQLILQSYGGTKRKPQPSTKAEPAKSVDFEEEQELPLYVLYQSNNERCSEFADAAEESFYYQDIKHEVEADLTEDISFDNAIDAIDIELGHAAEEDPDDVELDDRAFANERLDGKMDDEYEPIIKKIKKYSKRKHNFASAKDFECKICQRTFGTKSALKGHLKRDHVADTNTQELIKCFECCETFATYTQMGHHATIEHGGVRCMFCNKLMANYDSYRKHKAVHIMEKSFHCTYQNCHSSFHTKSRLNSHKRIVHTLAKNFVCDKCGYACISAGILTVHQRSHTQERPYKCETCNKCFPSTSQLNLHKQTHSLLRPYVCDICGKSFNCQKSLYHHKPLHLAEKKFKCKLCGNAYAQAAGLAAHMRKHREEQSAIFT